MYRHTRARKSLVHACGDVTVSRSHHWNSGADLDTLALHLSGKAEGVLPIGAG